MGVLYNSRIVTDGLVSCVDAGDKMSYPGAGTTWTDLSKQGNDGTLTNGPTFDSANGGSIVFDASDDYVNLGTASSLFPGPSITTTVACWIKVPTNVQNQVPIGNQYTNGERLYIGVGPGNYWDVGFGSYAWNGGYSGSRVTAIANKWTFLVLSVNSGSAKFYVDAQETITKTTDTSVTLGGFWSIGAFFGNGSINSTYTKACNIALTQIYNRALSAEEIKQNYNATKGRFGL